MVPTPTIDSYDGMRSGYRQTGASCERDPCGSAQDGCYRSRKSRHNSASSPFPESANHRAGK